MVGCACAAHGVDHRRQLRVGVQSGDEDLAVGIARDHVEVHVDQQLRQRHRRLFHEGLRSLEPALLAVEGDEQDRVPRPMRANQRAAASMVAVPEALSSAPGYSLPSRTPRWS
jgi:hypothetical protein